LLIIVTSQSSRWDGKRKSVSIRNVSREDSSLRCATAIALAYAVGMTTREREFPELLNNDEDLEECDATGVQ